MPGLSLGILTSVIKFLLISVYGRSGKVYSKGSNAKESIPNSPDCMTEVVIILPSGFKLINFTLLSS